MDLPLTIYNAAAKFTCKIVDFNKACPGLKRVTDLRDSGGDV
jgi:hypothetical protein